MTVSVKASHSTRCAAMASTSSSFVTDSPISTQPSSLAQLLGSQHATGDPGELDSDMRAPEWCRLASVSSGSCRRTSVISVNYLHSRGWHNLRSRNITAPLTSLQTASSAIYLYEAGGIFRQNQLITSLNARISPKLSFTGSYMFGQSEAATPMDAGTFAADPYNLRPEYGRAGFDIRHRVQLNGVALGAPWGIRISPFLVTTSGRPFNITVGRDLNQDTLFTDRPALATDFSRASGACAPHLASSTWPRSPGRRSSRGTTVGAQVRSRVDLRAAKIFKLGRGRQAESGTRWNLLSRDRLAIC